MGFNTTTEHEIVKYAMERTISFRSVSGPVPVAGTYTFNSLGESTRLTFMLVLSPKGAMALLGGFMARFTRRDLEKNYRVLKALPENPAYLG